MTFLSKLRRRKAPDPNSEAVITRSIRYWLRLKRVFHFKHWGGPLSEKGIPDICGVLPESCPTCGTKYGRALFIEIKKENGKLSPEQKEFLETAKSLGALAMVARSVEDVMAVIK